MTVELVVTLMAPPALVMATTPVPPVALIAPVPAPWPMSISPEPAAASMPSPELLASPTVTPAVSMVTLPAPAVWAETPSAAPAATPPLVLWFVTVTAPPRATVMSVSVTPSASTPKLPAPLEMPEGLAETPMVPVLEMSIFAGPVPAVLAKMPVESTPLTLTVVGPRWTVAVPVPWASASTPMLPMPSPIGPAALEMVIELPAPKPVMLALVFLVGSVAIASMPVTGLPALPASVTEMTLPVEPTMAAVLPAPPDLEMIPATSRAPPLTTVSESESARLALESLVALSTSMALIVGSIVSPAPRLTVATPSPVVVATTPWWPASTVTLSPRVTVTAATLAPLVIVALTPMPVEVPAGLALMCVPVTVSTSTEPVPLVVASTPSTLAHSSSPFTCTATSPALAALLTSAWMPTRAMSGVPSL